MAIALIFDMDGVIVDSNPTHADAWSAYLLMHGIPAADVSRRMVGRHNSEIVRDFFSGQALSAEAIAEHGAKKEALYREMMAPALVDRLVPGVREFLERYSEFAMAVASNAEPANVDFVLDTAGIGRYFRAVVNGHDVARPKPCPDIYLRAAELLGALPRECVVFEDSLTGVEAGRAAGMRVVGVGSGAGITGTEFTVPDFRAPELHVWLSGLARRA